MQLRIVMNSCCVLVLTTGIAVSDESIIAPGAHVEQLGSGFKFTEGPAADSEGNVYFTDQPNDRIMKWDTEGNITTYLQPCGRSNGLCFDKQNRLWACADEKNQMWLIDSPNKIDIVISQYGGKQLNGPNDVWVRPDGGLYFTDPFYKRPYWQRDAMEQDGQHVYFLPADRKKIVRVTEDLQQPNGVIGTPDGTTLYVADIKAKQTFAYDIQPDGTLENKRLFCEAGSDGMTIDNKGNVYLTGNGVLVFDRDGKKIEHISVDERWTANVCFGGSDGHLLFITASRGVYGLRMQVHGVGSQ
jgi:gluconolactonase